MANWFTREEEKKPAKTQEEFEIDLTKKIGEQVNSTVSETVGNVVKQYFENDPTLAALREQIESSRRRVTEQSQRQNQETQQTEQQRLAEIRENLDDNTRIYVDNQLANINKVAQQTSARELRRSIFEDAENYEYYTGDVKRKVDEMLDREPLTSQNNSDVVRNAYKVVVFEHMKDIQDKKLRSRLSSASPAPTLTGQNTQDPNALPSLNDEEKNFAKNMGISEADWARSKKEYMAEVNINV